MDHFHLPFNNPYSHAAAEEYLFRIGKPNSSCFFTYVNGPSVHLGRHQTADCECSREFCRRRCIPILRRISGGGTVYHDCGVISYGFTVPRELHSPEYYVDLIAEALSTACGRRIRRCPRCSLWLTDRKISGSAFALSGGRLLVHGCILVSADLCVLEKALHPSRPFSPDIPEVLRSVRSPVANLCGCRKDLTPWKLGDILHRIITGAIPGIHQWPSSGTGDCRRYEMKFQDREWLERS